MLLHNGITTVKSLESGNHFSYQIKTVLKGDLKGRRILSLLRGPDNTSDYTGFAFINEDGQIKLWNRFKNSPEYNKHVRILNSQNHPKLEFMLGTLCRRCNRQLNDPISISVGLGPTCRGEQ